MNRPPALTDGTQRNDDLLARQLRDACNVPPPDPAFVRALDERLTSELRTALAAGASASGTPSDPSDVGRIAAPASDVSVPTRRQRTLVAALAVVLILALGTLLWRQARQRDSRDTDLANRASVSAPATGHRPFVRPAVLNVPLLAAYAAPITYAVLDGPQALQLAREDIAERIDLSPAGDAPAPDDDAGGALHSLSADTSAEFVSAEVPEEAVEEGDALEARRAAYYQYLGRLRRTTAHPAIDSRRRYSELLTKIAVPQDKAAYGEFNESGYWSGTSWGGHSDLPAGYWVYVDDTWYIFKNGPGAEAIQPEATTWKARRRLIAEKRGTYSGLLTKIAVPADKESYGEYYESGYWTGNAWAGHKDLPPGYWVYVDGTWFIFKNGPGPAPEAEPVAPVQPAVDWGQRYSGLLTKIAIPQDKPAYGEFYESGYWAGTEYRGYTDLPPGYWVFVDGVWYIFKHGPGEARARPPATFWSLPSADGALGRAPELPASLHDDFGNRDRTLRLNEVRIADEQLDWTADGVKLSVPAGSNYLSIGNRYRIAGDFEVTAAFTVSQIETPKSGDGLGPRLVLDNNAGTAWAVGLKRNPDGTTTWIAANTTPTGHEWTLYKADHTSGQLQIARTGDSVSLRVADGDDSEFRDLRTLTDSTGTACRAWLVFYSAQSPATAEMTWSSLRIRTAAVPSTLWSRDDERSVWEAELQE